jgi:hypothetical protein
MECRGSLATKSSNLAQRGQKEEEVKFGEKHFLSGENLLELGKIFPDPIAFKDVTGVIGNGMIMLNRREITWLRFERYVRAIAGAHGVKSETPELSALEVFLCTITDTI